MQHVTYDKLNEFAAELAAVMGLPPMDFNPFKTNVVPLEPAKTPGYGPPTVSVDEPAIFASSAAN